MWLHFMLYLYGSDGAELDTAIHEHFSRTFCKSESSLYLGGGDSARFTHGLQSTRISNRSASRRPGSGAIFRVGAPGRSQTAQRNGGDAGADTESAGTSIRQKGQREKAIAGRCSQADVLLSARSWVCSTCSERPVRLGVVERGEQEASTMEVEIEAATTAAGATMVTVGTATALSERQRDEVESDVDEG
jgi:hypothetical protein